MDAASNTGVDDVRELRDRIGFSPSQGRFKVYIIDEVHMLSTAAFNALLKTLEEPPPHAMFVLATTEIHKIPATVLSRCQHEFKRAFGRHCHQSAEHCQQRGWKRMMRRCADRPSGHRLREDAQSPWIARLRRVEDHLGACPARSRNRDQPGGAGHP
jgi:hypothetical protein